MEYPKRRLFRTIGGTRERVKDGGQLWGIE